MEDLPDSFHVAIQVLSVWRLHFQTDSISQYGICLCTGVVRSCGFNNRIPVVAKFSQHLFNVGLCTAVRYADNRAFHFHEGLRRNSWTQLLLNLEFYGPPILLEYVHEEKFLGTVCSVVQGTTTTSQPTDSTVLRTLQSVGSREHVLSGFSARLARPMRLIRPQVEDLIEIYQGRGFSCGCLVQIAHPLLNLVGIHLS